LDRQHPVLLTAGPGKKPFFLNESGLVAVNDHRRTIRQQTAAGAGCTVFFTSPYGNAIYGIQL
jgi:hypothetical protein